MTLGSIRENDIILCDVRGQRFYGTVSAVGKRGVEVSTLCQSRLRIVTARQVIGHYRRSKSSRH
jgi:hypothetical protein